MAYFKILISYSILVLIYFQIYFFINYVLEKQFYIKMIPILLTCLILFIVKDPFNE